MKNENIWTSRLLSLADEAHRRGDVGLHNGLRSWALDEVNADGTSFANALLACGFKLRDVIANVEAAVAVVEPYTDCSKAIRFINEHFMNGKANGQLYAGQDPADAIIVLLRELLNHRADGEQAEFFMLYREGGRAPTHKHTNIDDARQEAKRIANESGETVHVLAKVDAVAANGEPTVKDVREHARRHPVEGVHGLWMVVRYGKFPEFVLAYVGPCDNVYVRRVSEGLALGGAHVADFATKEAKWFPLTPEGKRFQDEDIPF